MFQTQEFKPVPLSQTEDYEYMLALKQEFIATLHKSPYYLKLDDKKRDIERYSDKYNLHQQDCSDNYDIGSLMLFCFLLIKWFVLYS